MHPFANYYWDHPLLSNYAREIPAGAFLFHSQEPGNSVFIILSGIVELVGEAYGEEQIVTLIEPGQFLGEQAITVEDPFVRAFGARARSLVRVLEIDKKAAAMIQKQSPPLMIDILKQMFAVSSDRLERANQMIAILRSNNNEARLLALLLYFAHTIGVKTPQGTQIALENSTIRYYVEMTDEEIYAALSQWEDSMLLSLGPRGLLTVFDESALKAFSGEPTPTAMI